MMNKKIIMVGLPLIVSALLTGCSGGETPSLPGNGNNIQLSEATKSETPSTSPTSPGSATPTTSGESTGDTKATTPPVDNPEAPAGQPSVKLNETNTELSPDVKPLAWETKPAQLEAPVYLDTPETKVLNNPASASPAFATYVEYFNALKAKDYNKVCSVVDVHPSKGKDFCISWYKEFKSDTSVEPKIEDFVIAEEVISHDIVMTRKSGNKTSREYIKVKNIDGSWKMYDATMAAS